MRLIGGVTVRPVREQLYRVLVAALLWAFVSVILVASQNVGYMGDTVPVIVYIGLLLFVRFLPLRYLRAPLMIVFALALVKLQFYGYLPWDQPLRFLSTFGHNVVQSFAGVMQGDLQAANDGVRTLAFLGVVTFGTLLVEEAAEHPGWMLVATAVGEAILVYLSDQAGVHDAWETVIFLFIALLILMLTSVARQRLSVAQLMARASLSIGLAAVILIAGLAVPRLPTNWPKPANWFNVLFAAKDAFGATNNYGMQDPNIGGPFIGTHHVLLRVFANRPSYYQGETLNTFTGQGWVNTPQTPVPLSVGVVPRSIIRQSGPQVLSRHVFTQRVQIVRGTYPVLFGAYQIVRFQPPRDSGPLSADPVSDSVSAGTLHAGESYVVESDQPDVSVAALSKVRDGNLAYAFPNDLELPQGLPARDIALARRITAHAVGTYAKVEALIRYLQTHETYHLHNIPFPAPGQDVVDQFLFQTHRGYCDQFSSALAVLARAIGIPSRWVRGFIAVSPDPNYQGPGHEYVLRGTDAHSWTEIWFAGYGWIPFDATPAAGEPASYYPQALSTAPHHPSSTDSGQTARQSSNRAHDGLGLPGLRGFLRAVAAVLAGLVVIGAGMWLGWKVWRRARHRRSVSADATMLALMRRFERLCGRPDAGQTLRERALGIADPALQEAVMRFVVWYEKMAYGGGGANTDTIAQGRQLLDGIARARRVRAKSAGMDAPAVR
jgi:transglutaminase-like putative cysteine protease